MRIVSLNLDGDETSAVASALAATMVRCECALHGESGRCGPCRSLAPILADLTRMERRPRMRRPVTMPCAKPTSPEGACKVVPFRRGDHDLVDPSVAVSTRR